MIGRLTELIRSYDKANVLLVGDLILDRYVYGDAERISPEAPVPVLRVVDRQDKLGGTANVAACLRALGANVSCLGVIGADDNGKKLESLLQETGANAKCILDFDRQTTTKTRFVGLAQHRHRQQLLRLDEELTDRIPSAVEDKLIAAIKDELKSANIVCVEDYQKGVIGKVMMLKIIAMANEAEIPVIVDPARVNSYKLYSGATLLTPNRTELELATQTDFESTEMIMRFCNGLLDDWDVKSLCITLDREGSVIVEKGSDPIHLPTRPRSVYDNTGAGDVVFAVIAASMATGASLEEAARLANIAGGLEVEKFGCVPLTQDEILADLRIEDHRQSGKLRDLDDLVAELNFRRDQGETIVFTNGVFDILHPGHVRCLTKAKIHGSVLVVGMNSDESVRQVKGSGRPINDQRYRATILGALECVDYVVIFGEQTPIKLIEQINPDVIVKGADWKAHDIVGHEIARKTIRIPLVKDYSTTAIIDRIRK